MTWNRISQRAESLRVLTFNLYGVHASWEKRRQVVANGLAELKPDLMTFQETVLTGQMDQLKELFGNEVQVVHSRKHAHDGMGIATVSRWPIVAVREVDLSVSSRSGDFPSTALVAEIAVPAPIGPVLLVNHFPDWQVDHEWERERQAVIAARAIEDLLNEQPRHVILAGDLDAELDAASLRFLTGRQSLDGLSVCYRDAWESAHPGESGATFSSRNELTAVANWDWPNQQIDHILVRCGEHGGPTLAIKACWLAFAEQVNGVWASDHFAVVADLAMPPASSR